MQSISPSSCRRGKRAARVSLRAAPVLNRRSLARNRHGDAHAAADAKGGKPFLCAPPPHLMQERDENSGARGANRMPNCNRSAVHIHDGRIPAHILIDGERLGGKGLVRLDKIEVLGLPARFFKCLARGRDRSRAHHRRVDSSGRPRGNPGKRRFSASFALITITAAAPSLMPEAFPAVTVPSLAKAGLSFASASSVVPARIYSSASTVTSPFFVLIVKGAISSLNLPAFCAASALFCDARANSSCCWRLNCHLAATFSAVWPI